MVKEEVIKEILKIYREESDIVLTEDETGKMVVAEKIDSLELMKLIVSLEDVFDVEFDSDELDEDIFKSIESVSELVIEKKQNE